MLESQKIQVRQSEMRTAIRVLLDKGEPTDVEKTELSALRNEQDESETSLRAAIETEGVEATATVETPEKRELAQLTERSNLGSILSAVVEHRATGGPEPSYSSTTKTPISTATRASDQSDHRSTCSACGQRNER